MACSSRFLQAFKAIIHDSDEIVGIQLLAGFDLATPSRALAMATLRPEPLSADKFAQAAQLKILRKQFRLELPKCGVIMLLISQNLFCRAILRRVQRDPTAVCRPMCAGLALK